MEKYRYAYNVTSDDFGKTKSICTISVDEIHKMENSNMTSDRYNFSPEIYMDNSGIYKVFYDDYNGEYTEWGIIVATGEEGAWELLNNEYNDFTLEVG